MSLNKDQSEHERNELHDDAVKQEIVAILKADGAQFAGQIAKKVGQPVNYVTKLLHELEDNFEVEFKWTRGYSI